MLPRVQKKTVLLEGTYDVLKTLGQGQFGKVKVARHVPSGDKVAVKVINKAKLKEDPRLGKIVTREIEIMKKMHHKNVIELYDVIEDDSDIYMVMEYARGGEIFDFIVAHGKLKEEMSRGLFRQLVYGMMYCHSLGIIHRDLKAENLMLDRELNLKIIDFGLSNMWAEGDLLSTYCGSPAYVAPELLKRKPYTGPEADVWSLGVILYAFICGHLPFRGRDVYSMYRKILHCHFSLPEYVNPLVGDLIKKILVPAPKDRLTLQEILDHPWMRKGNEKLREDPLESTYDPEKTGIDEGVAELTSTVRGEDVGVVVEQLNSQKVNTTTATYRLLQLKKKKEGSLTSIEVKHDHKPGALERRRSFGGSELNALLAARHLNRAGTYPAPRERSSTTRQDATPRDRSLIFPAIATPPANRIRPLPTSTSQLPDSRGSGGSYSSKVIFSSALRNALAANIPSKTSSPVSEDENGGVYSAPSSPTASHKTDQKLYITTERQREEATAVESPCGTPVMRRRANTVGSTNSIIGSPAASAFLPVSAPRTVKFAFNLTTTTHKGPEYLLNKAKRVLTVLKFEHVQQGWVLMCTAPCTSEHGQVLFELEVCKVPLLSIHGLRMRRREGNHWDYKQVNTAIIAKLKTRKAQASDGASVDETVQESGEEWDESPGDSGENTPMPQHCYEDSPCSPSKGHAQPGALMTA